MNLTFAKNFIRILLIIAWLIKMDLEAIRLTLPIRSKTNLCPSDDPDPNCDNTTHFLCAKMTKHCQGYKEIPLGGMDRKYFIQGHNGIRNKVALDFHIANMNLLYWSRELESMAKRYLIECYIGLPKCFTVGKELLKTNLNYAFKERHLLGAGWPGRVVRSWYVEIGYNTKDWETLLSRYNKNPHSLANFTQMIWPTTEFIGCGGASMYHGFFVVCFYYPPFEKEHITNDLFVKIGQPCTECARDRATCSRTFPTLCGIDNELSSSGTKIKIMWIMSILFIVILYKYI